MAGISARKRRRLKAEVLARVAEGTSLRKIYAEPGMPFEGTVIRWRRTDEGFAAALQLAQQNADWRRRGMFDPERAEAYLARYRAGEPVDSIRRDPTMPGRKLLAYWCATQGAFAEELHQLKRVRREAAVQRLLQSKAPRLWDARTADRVLYRVGQGQSLKDLHKIDPTLPGLKVIARWRRERPEFDWEMRVNIKAGKRKQALRHCASQTDAITDRIVQGESFLTLAGQDGLPSAKTLYRWARDHRDFAIEVARACDIRDGWYADQMSEELERSLGATAKESRARLAPLSQRRGRLKARPGKRWL